jgi:archaellum component FlaC
MAQAQQILAQQTQTQNVTPLRRSPLTPGLASAAKRFGIRPDAVKRHEQFLKDREREMNKLRLQRDATKARYQALKGTVDELVERIQDVASEPTKAQAGDIQNIRTLLKQAYGAMERQQVELKGIRARTQRMERAAMKADDVHKEVDGMRSEILGYQKALYGVRKDMSDLMEIVEGEGGLKDLASQVRVVRSDLEETRKRTSDLEIGAQEQAARTMKIEQDMATLRTLMESNMNETAGVAGALLNLREEVNGLRRKMGHYIIDQIKLFRQK